MLSTELAIPGCHAKETVELSGGWTTFRAVRTADGHAVRIKAAQFESTTARHLARLRNEKEIAGALELASVVRATALETTANGLALVLEDPEALPLERLCGTPMDPVRFMRLAIQIAEALGELHALDVVHKDIQPHSILVDAAETRIWITNFGIATRLPREHQQNLFGAPLEGTVAYMSPEQTGRMNRFLDWRSDLYSLGVTFYRLLTGRLPFVSDDPLEMIHCHLAQKPVPPVDLIPGIPLPLSDIALKLLSKGADERFQSARGLRADLQRCLDEYVAGGAIAAFDLGWADSFGRYVASRSLHGRERETEVLLASYERVSKTGAAELVLLGGHAGIGYSFVGGELRDTLLRSRALFLMGKFEERRRGMPYAALVEMFRGLVQQVLTEDTKTLGAWRERVSEALGSDAQVLIDLIPQVEIILGKQPSVSVLPPPAPAPRVEAVLGRLFDACATPARPLVVFLEDLHWSDPESLRLLANVVIRKGMHHVLLIGAYRMEEVGASPALLAAIDAISTAWSATRLQLAPVAMDALIPLLADTLGAGSMDAEPLARMLHDKTGGDPLRVNQFLAAVHREGFIDFDDDKNDYLVGLIVNRIREMPEATQAALRTAACLGNRFDVRVVADVGNISVAQANEALRPACVDGLLVIEERARETHLWFHDRFQQAALSAISDAQLPQVRLDIGRAMLRESTPEELRARAFEIAGHLNDGISLLKDPRERLELARLNLMTGRRATEANAHAAGLGFLRTGIDLLPADAWDVELELALALYRARAECELYVGHNEEAERLLRIALDHAPGMLEKIDIYEALMIAHMNMLRFADAIAVGLDALQLLGISLPRDADGWRGSAASGMSLLRQRLAGIDVAELLDRPLADSPIHKAASRILDRMVPPAHNTSADLFVLITVELLKISLEHGHVGASPYGYECYGMLLPGAGGDQSTALEFGRLGVALVDKMGLIEGRSAVLFVFAYFICPWKRKLTESFASFRDGYRAGIEGRDPPHVAYNLMGLCQYTYFSGQPLECVDPELEKLEQYSREIRIEMAFGAGEALRQTLRALRGLTSHPTSLSDNAFDEKVFFRTMVEGKVYLTSNFYYLVKLQLCVLAGDLAGATASAKEFEAVKFVSSTTFMAVEYCFYHSLLLAAACASLSQEDRAGHLGKLRANLQQLEGWANDSPDNVRHKKLLIEAELARLENQDGDAVRGYEESIRTARKCGALRDEAIAHEAAGGFYLSRGRTAVGHAFITDARAVYMQWGAEAKVRQLDEKYCNRREGVSAAALGVGAAQLDAMAVIKGSQAISTELVLNKLVDSLMRVVIEHAGAETGYLLLFRDRQLWIEAAAGTALHGPNAIPPRVLALEAANLPQMIIDFVRQTGESVLLADATKENPFRGDPYIVEHEPRSVLCLPMKRQGQLIGMVYLENNLMTDAFSRDRVAILEVLSAQAAISIDNATLYEELEQRVEERTRELEASMRQLKENHAHLVVAERKAAVAPFEREMAIAQQIQISILPRNLSLEGLEVSAGMCTASEVGGDYYDVCATEDRGGWIGIGDVSGHGLYAGLIMLMIQSGLASLMRFAPFAEPHALLTLLNTMLYENVHERLASTDFATLSLFRYHRDGRLRVAGAHEDTLIWRAASGKCERIPTSGTWVAAMADVARHMTSKTHQLHAGDVVLLYTDGITEAMSPTREQFGVQRLSDALARFHELPVDEIRDRVFSTVNAWSSVLADDRTLVVLRYRGPSAVTVESGVS